ncbi:MAG: hypothetical protein QM751_10145 [Paludibacteraceae bacterium]
MKKNKIFLLICSLLVCFTSCLKDGDETLVLPNVVYAIPIDDVVPVELQSQIDDYMPIYKGSTPPDITGVYLVDPDVLVYTSDGVFSPGKIFADDLFRFDNQNTSTNVLTYANRQGDSAESSSDYVSVSGKGSDFTAYFLTTGTSNNIAIKTATIISGTKTKDGIKNYYTSFVMLEKGSDPKGLLMDEDEFRIFKDNDGLASNSVWNTGSQVKRKNVSENTNNQNRYEK